MEGEVPVIGKVIALPSDVPLDSIVKVAQVNVTVVC